MNIHVLDCTLRDGGYVNQWHFGFDNAREIVPLIYKSGVDYVEVGFIGTYDYKKDTMLFNSTTQVEDIFNGLNTNVSLMVHTGYGYPVSAFPQKGNLIKMIRVVMFKRNSYESAKYCEALKAKGYDVCIQFARTDQYNYNEFRELLKLYNDIQPTGIYIVDSFGVMNKEILASYVDIADEILNSKIKIGYHAHNNMQQAFTNAVYFCEREWNRDILIDGSVMGIGRGPGNLCLELLEKYLNDKFKRSYKVENIYEVAEKYIEDIYIKTPWGYSIPYMLSALYGRNPDYVSFMESKGLKFSQMSAVFSKMKEQNEGLRFDKDYCNKLISELIRK